VEWVAEDCFLLCSFRQLGRQQLTPAKGIAKDCGAVRSVDASNKQQSNLDDHALPQLWSGLPRIVFLFVRFVSSTDNN
jgi:hypothetical protein